MTRYDIIEQMAKERRVEQIVKTVCKVSRVELDDLAQMIYEAMLLYDERKIVSLYEKGQINYFVVRIVQNQFYSGTSQYHAMFRKEQTRHLDVGLVANRLSDETE